MKKEQKSNGKLDEKSLQVLSCSLAVAVLLLLLSGDMIISQFLRVNPNQDYPLEEKQEESNSGTEVFENDSHKEEPSVSYDVSYMKESSISEILQKIASKETVFLFSGRSTCPPCRAFVPVLKKVSEKWQLDNLYYLDRSKIHSETEGYQEFLAYSHELQTSFTSTPYFMIFQNGVYQESVIGMYETNEALETVLNTLIQKYQN